MIKRGGRRLRSTKNEMTPGGLYNLQRRQHRSFKRPHTSRNSRK
jgi:hypothetical protein